MRALALDPEVFHPCHHYLIMENGIHLQEGITFEGLGEAWVFAYVFAPPRSSARRVRPETDCGAVA
jgi:hypothetical protein